MDGLLNLLPLYTEETSGEKELNLGQFIETCRIHQSFSETDSASEQSVHSHALGIINAKLNNAESRVEGALLLDAMISQCRTETFTSNCLSWVQQVMRLLQGSSKAEGGVTACIILGKLLVFSSQFPEACRQISTTTISQLVPLLCDEDSNHQMAEHTLECLESCMKHYSGSCGPMKGTIERHLISMIDSEDLPVGLWSTCVALIPSLGGSGTQGMQLKTNWIEMCSQLVHAIHGCIDNLFANITEIKNCEIVQPNRALKLPPLSSQNPMVLLHSQRRRFTNLCSALASLLKDPFPASKNIPVDQLLELIARLLALNSKTLSKAARANFEQLTLASLMPDLHSACIDLLTALIGTCKGQLLTRAGQVMNFFVQVLQWTFTPFDQRRAAVERPYEKLRSKVYRGLVFWLIASRSACGLTKCSDVLVSQLLSDIVVQRDTIQLLTVNVPTSISNGGNRLSKKSKKKMLTDDAPGVIQQKVDIHSNAQVCQAALHCLSILLLYCGPRLKPAAHKEIQEVVLSILIDIMNGTPLKTLLPYNSPSCRGGLYRVLEKLILCPSAQWPAPLNYATSIFNNGLNDPNLEVSMLCAEGLVNIQSILRPRGPTLNLALDVKQMRYVQEEASLLDGLMKKNSLTLENGNGESNLSLQFQPTPPVELIQIRMPEVSPLLSSANVTSTALDLLSVRMDETPPSHVSSVPVVPAVSASSERVKTPPVPAIRAAPPKAIKNDTQPEQNSARKRPHAETEPAKSKILKELPYGTDDVDDDVDAMLASFRDVPAM